MKLSKYSLRVYVTTREGETNERKTTSELQTELSKFACIDQWQENALSISTTVIERRQ